MFGKVARGLLITIPRIGWHCLGLRSFSKTYIARTRNMFGPPERTIVDGAIRYYIPMTVPKVLGVRYERNEQGTVLANLDHQGTMLTVKNEILSELTRHTQLFRNPPTLESLQAITPNWGCILVKDTPQWNPYTILLKDGSPCENLPCYVDLALTGVFLSRSSVSPQFSLVFLEKAQPSNLIEIDWDAHIPEVEEISDIQLPDAGSIKLRDPAVLRKIKHDAKTRIREAFQQASEMRNSATNMALRFTQEYDVSDNESLFSEWLGESGSEDE